jgi:hypothetical protein
MFGLNKKLEKLNSKIFDNYVKHKSKESELENELEELKNKFNSLLRALDFVEVNKIGVNMWGMTYKTFDGYIKANRCNECGHEVKGE